MQGKDGHGVTIDASQAGGQTFHRVHNSSTGTVVAEYTYADGYMIIAPTRALLMDALHAHSTGDSLGHSASFKALLPVDQNENYSAVAYQNLGPVLTPLLSQMSGESADALKSWLRTRIPRQSVRGARTRGSKWPATATCSGLIS